MRPASSTAARRWPRSAYRLVFLLNRSGSDRQGNADAAGRASLGHAAPEMTRDAGRPVARATARSTRRPAFPPPQLARRVLFSTAAASGAGGKRSTRSGGRRAPNRSRLERRRSVSRGARATGPWKRGRRAPGPLVGARRLRLLNSSAGSLSPAARCRSRVPPRPFHPFHLFHPFHPFYPFPRPFQD